MSVIKKVYRETSPWLVKGVENWHLSQNFGKRVQWPVRRLPQHLWVSGVQKELHEYKEQEEVPRGQSAVSTWQEPEMKKDSILVFTLKAIGNNKRASMREWQDAVWTTD